MAVVAGHVGMEVLPEALDAIVVRTVGRKEVELDATQPPQSATRLTALVDAVVVQNDVDAFGVTVVLGQLLEQFHEEGRVLLVGARPYDCAVASIQCPSEVGLRVLPGSHDNPLMTATHPVQPDFRVEVDIDLVLVDGNLVSGEFSDQLTNLRQASALLPWRKGTDDGGLGIATVCAKPTENAANDTDADSDSSKFVGNARQ